MSFLIADTIPDIQLETQTVGVRISTDDIILGYKRANSYFNSTYKMPTTQRQQDLLVFPGVFEYAPASDFLGWFEPMRPYGNTSPWFTNTTQNELTHTYDGNQTAFKFDRENQFLIVSIGNGGNEANGSFTGGSTGAGYNVSQTIINACDTLTDNGTVTLTGDGSNLILDTQIFVQGSASYRFNITDNGGTTTITFVGQDPVDLTQYFEQGQFFLSLECPNSNTVAIPTITWRIGSDNTGVTDYYEMIATENYRGDTILNSWCQVGFNPLANSTTIVGSPNVQSPTYMQITIANGVTGTSGFYRLDNIFAALPTYFQLPYYSKYNVKDINGVYKQNPTSEDDIILSPDDTNEALVFKCLEHLAIYNLKDQGLAMHFAALLAPFEVNLKTKYPSQERKVQSQYYRSPIAF